MTADPSYPLADIKVLDMSRVLAGPFAGRMLSDLGADVVKVEPPDGDVTRLWGRTIGGVPGYYHQQNAGKRNICIDLRAPGARDLVLDLVRKADILIENYRPDVMPRLGLGYEALKAVNPGLIMLSISGFGQGGPESHKAAYAPIIHAEMGLIHRMSRRGGFEHHDLPLSVADTNAGLHGLVGLLAALHMRQRTGLGQHVDIAMVDATIATDDQLQYELDSSQDTAPLPSAIWTMGAGPALVSADFRFLWRLLVQHHGMPDPTTQDMDQSARIAARVASATAFMANLMTWDEVEVAMKKMNLAWGRVRSGRELHDHPTLNHRGTIAQVDDRAGGTRPTTQSPYRFSDASSGVRAGAPHRGEHNAAVLSDWLGENPDAVQALTAGGVLIEPDA